MLALATDALAAERADIFVEYRDVLARGDPGDAGRLRSLMTELGKSAVAAQADSDALAAAAALQSDLASLPAARVAAAQAAAAAAQAGEALAAAQVRSDAAAAEAAAATRLVVDLEAQGKDLDALELAHYELFGNPKPAVQATRLTLAQATPSAAALSAITAGKLATAERQERAERAERIRKNSASLVAGQAERLGTLPPDTTPMQGCVEVP